MGILLCENDLQSKSSTSPRNSHCCEWLEVLLTLFSPWECGGKEAMNQIYYVGYDAVHPENFRYDIPGGFDYYLLVVTTTAAVFRFHETVSEYPAHTAVLYPPNSPIWYGAAGKPYGNHWIRFTTDESFVTDFPQQGIPFSISDPEYFQNLFRLLTWETSQITSSSRIWKDTGIITQTRDAALQHCDPGSLDSSIIISQLLRILFYKLQNELRGAGYAFHDQELLSLRRRISAAPQYPWNVPDMAKELHISAGHLQLIYRQKFHISCMDDVIHFRILKARDLLEYTTQSIAEIALQCGYNNTEHFCRQFRKVVGTPPGQYRRRS